MQGTADFMAGEIESQLYRFLPGLTPPTTPVDSQKQPRQIPKYPSIIDSYEASTHRDDEPIITPAIRYNPLHDLESLWWIAVYFIVKHEVFDPTDPETEGQFASATQWKYAADLFDTNSLKRITFEIPFHFLTHTSCLQPVILPIITRLENMRCSLIYRYHQAERNLDTIDRNTGGQLYQMFYSIFQGVAQAKRFKNVFIRPFTPYDVVRKAKWPKVDDVDPGEPIPKSSFKRARSQPDEDSEAPDQHPDNVELNREAKRRRTTVPHKTHGRRSRPYLPRQAKSQRDGITVENCIR